MFKKLVILTIFLILSISTASATVSYSSSGGITWASSDNIHDVPGLYTALCTRYTPATIDSSVLSQVSTGVWWSRYSFNVPSGGTFYINNTTCSELRLGVSNGGSLIGYPIINNTKLVCYVSGAPATFDNCGQIILYVPLNNTIANNFYGLQFDNLAHVTIQNVSMNSTRNCIKLNYPQFVNMDHITVTNSSTNPSHAPSGIFIDTGINCVLSNITTYKTGNYQNPATSSYGLVMYVFNTVVKDSYFDNMGWSGINVMQISNNYSNNNTFYNVTVDHSGHNGFENEGNNSTFVDIKVSNSVAHNIFQIGRDQYGRPSANNVWRNVTSINPGTSGFHISEGSTNTTAENITITGNGFETDDTDNATAINITQDGNAAHRGEYGYRYTVWSSTNFGFCKDNVLIDGRFKNNTYGDVGQLIGERCRYINCNLENNFALYDYYTINSYYTYYYPNITVKNLQGRPVQNAVITVNTSALNGYGKSQTSYYTDSNGRLQTYGNRTNWLAIPDIYYYNHVTTSYLTTITASKAGKSVSSTVNPSGSWYSTDPMQLASPTLNMVLDVSSDLPPVANFNSNVSSGTSPFNVSFTDTSTNSPTAWKWDFGDGTTSTAQNPIHTYSAGGTKTVTLNASNPAGYSIKSGTIAVSVVKTTPTIAWDNLAGITYGTALSNTQLNAIASVPGTFTYTPHAGTILGVGTQTLRVDFTPTDSTNYSTTSANATIIVSKATPTITWNNPADMANGVVLGDTQLNAVTTVPGTFVYNPTFGTVLSPGSHTLHVDFTPTDTTNYTTASKDVTISVINKTMPSITWANPANITYGTRLSSTQLNAAANVTGNFVYDPAAGTILGGGTNTLTATFVPADTVNYTTTSKSVPINVSKRTPSITWSRPSNIIYRTTLSGTQLNARGSVPGTFVYTPTTGTYLSVGTHTLSTTLEPSDSTNYTNASKSVNILVSAKNRKAYFYGDSLISGFPGTKSSLEPGGSTSRNPYGTISYQFEQVSGITSYDMGYTGQTTSQISSRLNNNISSNNCGYCFIEGGVNDIYRNTADDATIVANTRSEIEACENSGTQPVLFLIFPFSGASSTQSERINFVNSAFKNLVTEYPDLIIADVRPTVGYNSSAKWFIRNQYNSGDNTHYNKAGYAKIGDIAWSTLKNTGINYPTAKFSASPTNGYAPLRVRFTDSSTGSPTSYAWDLNNDGVTDRTTQNCYYTYPAAGNYTAKLTVSNNAGSHSTTKIIYVAKKRAPYPWR
jgi:PKD repeat protein